MKKLKIFSILGLSALFVLSACNKDDSTEDPGTGEGSPVLTLSETTLTVAVEGGVVSVDYQVENPVDGSTVSVDLGSVTWITDFTVTDSNIELTVEANSEEESRTATLTVSYPGAEDVSLTVVQEAFEVQYDYNYTLNKFNGTFYEDYGQTGEDMFYIWLSDIGFDDEGLVQAGGYYYNFRIFVNEADGSSLPTGTYTATTSNRGDMVFSSYSRYVAMYEVAYDHFYLTDGSITVSAEGDTYTIEGIVIDENGASHRIYYTGTATIDYGGSAYDGTLAEDVDITANSAAAYYWAAGSTDEVMNVDFTFTDMGTSFAGPGYILIMNTYMPYDADGKIAEGVYTVNKTADSMTIFPGDYTLVDYRDASYSRDAVGYITLGTMTVTAGSEDYNYTIVCDFTTYEGFSVKCTYTGELVVWM